MVIAVSLVFRLGNTLRVRRAGDRWDRLQPGLDGFDQFTDSERLALNLVVALGIDQES